MKSGCAASDPAQRVFRFVLTFVVGGTVGSIFRLFTGLAFGFVVGGTRPSRAGIDGLRVVAGVRVGVERRAAADLRVVVGTVDFGTVDFLTVDFGTVVVG